jgi:hypothetical protein
VPAPSVTVLSDSTAQAGRTVALRIRPAPGTLLVQLQLLAGLVQSARIDGRTVDPSRYRYRPSRWLQNFAGPPDSGFVLELTVAPAEPPVLEVMAQAAGLPALPGVEIPPRPARLLPTQSGDVTVARRLARLDPGAGR